MSIKFATVCILGYFLISCDTTSNSSTSQTNDEASPDSIRTELSSEDNASTTGTDASIAVFELLQGKWQHSEDTTNYLVFEGDHRKEIAEGMNAWDDETFTLSDRCMNQSDKDKGMEPEKDRYISLMGSDLCWYVVHVDKENLSLSYVGRGNTLTYRRVE